jgi:peptidoglycan/LPS O-acetylase OafA/YrhL
MIDFKYRPDVDGLRAVAVVLVLLFHADFGFTGGFVGVDVFFVISGFLITGLLLKEFGSEGFHLSSFWLRRIRRILPASMVVVMATLVASFFILLPIDFQQMARSAIAQQLMMSNIFL